MRRTFKGSIAHAQMLATVGLLTAEEQQQIEQTLTEIGTEIEQDRFPLREWSWKTSTCTSSRR